MSLSQQEKKLTETRTHVESERERTRTQLNELNETVEKMFVQNSEQSKTNQKTLNEIKRVEVFSNHMGQKCNNMEISFTKLTQSTEDRMKRLAEQVHNDANIRSEEINKQMEKLSMQINEVRENVNTEIVPPAEKWDVRNRNDENNSSDSDIEQRVKKFHESVHRNKSLSCEGNVPWDMDSNDHVSRRASSVCDDQRKSMNHVRFNDCMNSTRNISRSSSPFSSDLPGKCNTGPAPKKFSEEINMNRKSKISIDDDCNEMDVFAQLMNKIVAKTNNIQLPVFDGVSSDLDSYKRQCLAVARQNEWNSVDLAIRIVSSLQGDARSLMNLLPVGQEYDLDCIWNILKSRFDRPLSPEVAKNQLANVIQKRGETFLHLSLQIEKLIDRAYPLANEPMRVQLLLDHFIKSIASSAVRYEIRLRNPRDINQAKQWAEEISMIQASEKFQRMTYVNKISCRDEVEDVDESSSEEDLEERKKNKRKKLQRKDSKNCLKDKSVQMDANRKSEQHREESTPYVSERCNQRSESCVRQNYAPKDTKQDFKAENFKEQPRQFYRQSSVPRQQYPVNRGRIFQSNRGNVNRNDGNVRDQQDVRGGNFVNRGEQRGRSGWFNRENLENLYYGKDVRQAKDQRTRRNVSRQ